MPSAMQMKDLFGRLSAAKNAGVIEDWKVLGSLVLIRTKDRNVYAPFDAAKKYMEELTADC